MALSAYCFDRAVLPLVSHPTLAIGQFEGVGPGIEGPTERGAGAGRFSCRDGRRGLQGSGGSAGRGHHIRKNHP